MSTRSNIAIENADGTVSAIYCDHDGYPSHNGEILLESYQDKKKVKALIALGSLSCLAEQIGERHDFDAHGSYSDQHKPEYRAMCLAYGRDRGEKDVDAESYPDVEQFLAAISRDVSIQYAYLFREGRWYWSDTKSPWAELTKQVVDAD